ncbi:MAG: hypothetical protein AAFY66_14700, partial [Pseudomonadota bacterium]
MPDRIEIVEVGPRDGLQNEPRPIATLEKIALVDALSACGFARIEAASFVNPRAVPQMADGAAVMAGIVHLWDSPGVDEARRLDPGETAGGERVDERDLL